MQAILTLLVLPSEQTKVHMQEISRTIAVLNLKGQSHNLQEQQALRGELEASVGQMGALEEALQVAVNNESDQSQALTAAAAELESVRDQVQSGFQVAL